MAKEVGMICEQGDLGLHYDPLTESEQRTLEQQDQKNNNKEEDSKS